MQLASIILSVTSISSARNREHRSPGAFENPGGVAVDDLLLGVVRDPRAENLRQLRRERSARHIRAEKNALRADEVDRALDPTAVGLPPADVEVDVLEVAGAADADLPVTAGASHDEDR